MPYVCTAGGGCKEAFEKYIDWCSHEVMSHKGDFDIWVCDNSNVASKNLIPAPVDPASAPANSSETPTGSPQEATTPTKALRLVLKGPQPFVGFVPCDIGFRDEQEFIEHRFEKHNDRDPYSDAYLTGPRSDIFYCGFCRCRKTITGGEGGAQFMTARLRHISTHFEAGCRSSGWVPLTMH